VISTIAFRNTTLSERMTGNSVDRNVSFQAAESAGKEALTLIVEGTASALTNGYYSVSTPAHPTNNAIAQGGTTTFWNQGDGATVSNTADCPTTMPFSWKSCAAAVTTKYANNAKNAQFVIELLKRDTTSGNPISTFRVTSRSTGGSDNADVVLQTIFVCGPPDQPLCVY
jgi:Tfp pilus assembly protein PilX